jgi:hypothetical protein
VAVMNAASDGPLYAGSGETDTARSLLVEILGDDAACPLCAGAGRVLYVRDDTMDTLQLSFPIECS